tara:strand:- start:39 stop:581 length:543 start_codon:yes stop_codon:yes gene_type:complete
MTWLELLEMAAAIMGVLAIILAIMIITSVLYRLIPKKAPQEEIEEVKETKEQPKRRIENMSNDQAKEGVTFNDIFMFMIAVPLVLLWVGFAGYVIFHGLQDQTVLQQIEGYTTLIAILGGPALLIIKDALDVWKQEQAEKTAFYKMKAQSVIDYNAKAQEQAQMIEAKEQDQQHKMQLKK